MAGQRHFDEESVLQMARIGFIVEPPCDFIGHPTYVLTGMLRFSSLYSFTPYILFQLSCRFFL